MSGASRDDEFSAFVAARQVHLRRIAYAVCGDWHRADDLLQTALVKLYVAWPRLHLDGREEAYTRQIIVRANIDESRRPWRREMSGLDGHDPVARPELPTEERSALFDALQALPSMQRKVIVLRHWLGLSVEETARELGIVTGTVKSHSSRGIVKLQAALASMDGTDPTCTNERVPPQTARVPSKAPAPPDRR
ncbi:MAG TPA: SigE family RNA polymerase sigma factor [Nocardioidaceae bacterium]|jgi:RNA polymerase sigma-70 factor (sigma-E family)|nr:SigE family RNA polymerase sigma factor [Nocardioidaceae bacterium]